MAEHTHSRHVGWPSRWETIALACLVLIGYGNIINAYFLADDFLLIHTVLDGQGRPDWTVALQHLYKTQYVETLRPLVTLIHTVSYSLWGAHPAGYHLLNLGFHLLNGLLLYALVREISRHPSRLFAFCAAAVFVTHPVHPEAVTYIGSLPGLMCTTFYLLALRCAFRYSATSRRYCLAFGVGSFLCALASKEEAVSLPFSVGLLASALPGRHAIRSRLWASIRTALPFFAVLGLYLAYRWLIFGHITPIYYRGVDGTPMDVLRGLGGFVTRLIAPINLAYANHSGRLICSSVFTTWVIGLVALAYIERPPITRLGFCVGAFLILLIPVNKVLIFGISDGLTNSRFLYFPSLAFAGFVASVMCGETRRSSRLPLGVLVCYVGLFLPQLVANNFAWVEASRLMRRMQQESRWLTGNIVNVEVVNIPDTVHGVFFDRGGFRHALLRPFVPDNAMHHREQILRIPLPIGDRAIIESTFPEPSALNGTPDLSQSADQSMAIRVMFQPREPKLYRGELVIRHPSCPRSAARIAVRGQGTLAPPFATYIAATLSPGDAFRARADALTVVASIADAKDGIAAEDVSIQLLPDEPWSLRYFDLDSTGRRGPANTPVRIEDGSSKAIIMELTPAAHSQPSSVIAPRISALNAPIVPAIPYQTIISAAGVMLEPSSAYEQTRRPNPHVADGLQPDPEVCPQLHGIPTEIDFGVVPTSPYPLRQDRPFTYYGQPAALLFWDDTQQRLLPLAQVEHVAPVFRAVGSDLSHWQRSPALQYSKLSAEIAGFYIGGPSEFIAASDVDIQTSEGAFFLLTMRVSGATSPYAMLSWKRAPDEPDSARGTATLVIVPDGYWHTYAIPLHALASWRGAQRVRYLRLQPVLSEG